MDCNLCEYDGVCFTALKMAHKIIGSQCRQGRKKKAFKVKDVKPGSNSPVETM